MINKLVCLYFTLSVVAGCANQSVRTEDRARSQNTNPPSGSVGDGKRDANAQPQALSLAHDGNYRKRTDAADVLIQLYLLNGKR
jgi:hypothetical protein